jgi:hypothetical protein
MNEGLIKPAPLQDGMLLIVESTSSNDDNCSQKSSSSSQEMRSKNILGEGVSTIKRADEEEAEEISCSVQKRESEDKARLNSVRTLFY